MFHAVSIVPGIHFPSPQNLIKLYNYFVYILQISIYYIHFLNPYILRLCNPTHRDKIVFGYFSKCLT